MSNFLKGMMMTVPAGDAKKPAKDEVKSGITFDDNGKLIRINTLKTDNMAGLICRQPDVKEVLP